MNHKKGFNIKAFSLFIISVDHKTKNKTGHYKVQFSEFRRKFNKSEGENLG